jgi:predicted MFS family arabinose efflux permease
MAAVGAAGVGAGFYGLHTVLQTNAAQIAPLARATGVGLFATALFLGQGAGAWVGAHIYDAYGATPIFCLSMLGLPLIALYVLRHVAGRGPEAAGV